MEAIAVVILIGAVLYFLFKHTTERGANAVRAYVYLRAIDEGATAEEANLAAQTDIVNASTQTIRETQLYVQSVYGGKQLPMIAEARRLGFLSVAANNAFEHTHRLRMPQSRMIHAVGEGHSAHIEFDTYNAIFIAEIKRLSGKSDSDLHWIELVDDTGTRNAFADGVDPKALALAVLNWKPPL